MHIKAPHKYISNRRGIISSTRHIFSFQLYFSCVFVQINVFCSCDLIVVLNGWDIGCRFCCISLEAEKTISVDLSVAFQPTESSEHEKEQEMMRSISLKVEIQILAPVTEITTITARRDSIDEPESRNPDSVYSQIWYRSSRLQVLQKGEWPLFVFVLRSKDSSPFLSTFIYSSLFCLLSEEVLCQLLSMYPCFFWLAILFLIFLLFHNLFCSLTVCYTFFAWNNALTWLI